MSDELNSERFLSRLKRLHTQWTKAASLPMWGGASALCLMSSPSSEDDTYKKSIALQLHLMAWELPDTVMVLAKDGTLYVLGTPKKCAFLEKAAAEASKSPQDGIKVVLLPRNKADANAENHKELVQAVKKGAGGGPFIIGSLLKETFEGPICSGWMAAAKAAGIETAEVSSALGLLLSVKDEQEVELVKRASILTNKVLKYGFIQKMQEVIEDEVTTTHEKLAQEVQDIMEDPSKIKLNVSKDLVESCYFPIVQSGGQYQLKASAQSDERDLSYDIILCSMGARYKSYCANVSRSFFINPPKKVQNTYRTLLSLYHKCLDNLRPGEPVKGVVEKAHRYLRDKSPELEKCITKTLGFSLGLDYREVAMVISAKNATKLKDGMVFNLSVGLQDVPLSASERKGFGAAEMETFSVMIADTVVVKDTGAEVLTKQSKEWKDVCYNLKGDAGSDDNNDEDEDDDGDGGRAGRGGGDGEGDLPGAVKTRRMRDKGKIEEQQELTSQREGRMSALLKKRAKERAAALERRARGEEGSGDEGGEEVDELAAYEDSADYPRRVQPNQLFVDMDKEVVFAPINGQPVPLSIHTIKNVIQPDPDNHCYYLRINFFTSGSSLGKEASRTMAKLVDKHTSAEPATFVKELIYRSLERHNLDKVYRQIQELRKRLRTREQKAMEEADLVTQAKLIRSKDQRVPRLQDLTMRPNITGKTIGALEAHSNGLRFTSQKHAPLDFLYANIKHAFYQPCNGVIDTKVILHFSLKHPIMVGKKAHKEIQVSTEAIDATVNLDGVKRSNYDPDEMMEEQRERGLRKRLNNAFKDFASKVTKAASRDGQSLEFDIPFDQLGFGGKPFKEMGFIQPTTYALINITDFPFFVVPLNEIEHVHFERVFSSSKTCDMKIIMKENMLEGGGEPKTIDMIDQNKYLNKIMQWLEECEITYTQTAKPWAWKHMMTAIRGDNRFYLDTYEDGERKPAGWARLREEDSEDDDEENDGESDFTAESSEEESSEEDSDDDSEDASEDDSEEEGDDELEEEGLDWDELEKRAKRDDSNKRDWGEGDQSTPKASAKRRRR
ncbi:unnamed protein product [Scytosiphon promiscuus]